MAKKPMTASETKERIQFLKELAQKHKIEIVLGNQADSLSFFDSVFGLHPNGYPMGKNYELVVGKRRHMGVDRAVGLVVDGEATGDVKGWAIDLLQRNVEGESNTKEGTDVKSIPNA